MPLYWLSKYFLNLIDIIISERVLPFGIMLSIRYHSGRLMEKQIDVPTKAYTEVM